MTFFIYLSSMFDPVKDKDLRRAIRVNMIHTGYSRALFACGLMIILGMICLVALTFKLLFMS